MQELQKVRRHLAASRRAGLSFQAAWPLALEVVRDRDWREALSRTASAWLAAYDGTPPARRECAADAVSRGENGELADLAQERCPHCGGLMPPSRGRGRRVWCSELCRRRASRRRKGAVA